MKDEQGEARDRSSFIVHRSSFEVVVATPDVVGERMAGPGIRATYFARELAKIPNVNVTLVSRDVIPTVITAPSAPDGLMPIPSPGLRPPSPGGRGVSAEGGSAPHRLVESLLPPEESARSADEGLANSYVRNDKRAREAIERADVLLGQPARGFFKRRRGQRIVYDLFDPLVLELRELYGAAPSLRQRIHLMAEWSRLLFALRFADLLICASPQQREFYRKLQSGDAPWIDVPFGVDLSEVKRCEPARDNLVVWGGGVWEWLDPKTAVDAIVKLNRAGLRCRLLFLGRARPNQARVERRREGRFEQLLTEGAPYVDANAEWVPYRERLSWLRSGKAAIMLHRQTAEADVSVRTRLFDAIAAGVPVVATERGFAADLVEREGLGIVVPPMDAGVVAAAVRRLLTDDEFHAGCVRNLERIRPRFAWEVVTRPLVDAIIEWQKQAE
jgi:glycosyltransferase involved in cell wall biosynthesis